MRNKFLDYLLNEKLKDITYSLLEKDSERQKKYSEQLEEYSYVDDMFIFFKEANISQEDLFMAIRKEQSSTHLAKILLGYELQNDKNREQKLEDFSPLFNNNINFFRQALNICLSEHKYIRDEFKEYNKNFFEKLISIGIDKGFFDNIKDSELETEVQEYKKILVDNKIFNKEYDVEQTLKLLVNERNRTNELGNHFTMFSDEIYQYLKEMNSEKLIELKEKITKETKVEPEEIERRTKDYLNKFSYYLSKVKKENFKELLNNKIILDNIVDSNGSAFSEIIKYPHLLNDILDKIDDNTKKELFNSEKYISGSMIRNFIESNADKVYMDDNLFLKILDNIEEYVIEKKDTVITHLLFNQHKKLENKELLEQLIEKNIKSIVKSLQTSEQEFYNFKYDEKFIKYKELTKSINSDLINKINHKLHIAEQDTVYKNIKDIKGYLDYKIKPILEHLSQYIEKTGDIDVMGVLNADPKNPLWKEINFNYDLAKKHYDNENIYAYLLRKASAEKEIIIIDYLIKENPENFLDVKLGKKDIIAYYFKEFENSNPNQKSKTIISVFNSILDDKNAFEIILKNNKVKLKMLATINDDELNKKLNYQLMSAKFDDVEKKDNSKKMKI